MKKITFIFLFLVIACNSSTVYEPVQTNTVSALELNLSLDKKYYISTDTINATITLINLSSGDVLVNSRMALNSSAAPAFVREISLYISTPSRQETPFTARVHPVYLNDGFFIFLNPQSFVSVSYDIERLYDLGEIGDYSVFAVYENQANPENGLNAWMGTINSNLVEFTLSE